ncbi:hypothetical protein Tco_1478749, partial [Tanacetum coccineum]
MDEVCSVCCFGDGDSFTYDLNPNSFNDLLNFSNYPPQPKYETYSCELCGNDSHHGYDCPPRFPLVYEQEPSYNQNFSDNYYPQNSPSFPQQYLNCENCRGPHESFQCQPMNQNYFEPNSSGFDQFQPPQYSVVHQPPQETSTEMLQARENLMEAIQAFLKKYDQIPPKEKNYEESTIPLNEIVSQIPPSIAITPVLTTLEPEDSLIMGNEELSTIPEKESDEFIKSSVEDLVPIPSESEDTSESNSECILPLCDDFSPINVYEEKSVTFSNPLFDSNNDFTSSDDESLSDEDFPEDNVKIYSNPLFEFDDEYISSDVNPLFDEELENIESRESYVSNLDEPDLLVIPFSDANEDEGFDLGGDIDKIDAFLDIVVSTDIVNDYYDSERDIIY